MTNPKYYLVHVLGCTEPRVVNPTEPCESFDEILKMGQAFCQQECRRQDVIFYLRVGVALILETAGDGCLTAGSFTDEQLYPEDKNGTDEKTG